MWQEVKVPRREHQLLHFHGNNNESSLPHCLGHLLYETDYVYGGASAYGCTDCNFWPYLKSILWKENTETNKKSESRASWLVVSPAPEKHGPLPYNSLCNAESSLIYVVFFLPWLPLASFAKCWLSNVMLHYSFRNENEYGKPGDILWNFNVLTVTWKEAACEGQQRHRPQGSVNE